eukprot:m.86357 g.86357  ORF g.86357 m.86357 type:complete len:335 (+) comp25957_c0_seq2:752-1756(+)
MDGQTTSVEVVLCSSSPLGAPMAMATPGSLRSLGDCDAFPTESITPPGMNRLPLHQPTLLVTSTASSPARSCIQTVDEAAIFFPFHTTVRASNCPNTPTIVEPFGPIATMSSTNTVTFARGIIHPLYSLNVRPSAAMATAPLGCWLATTKGTTLGYRASAGSTTGRLGRPLVVRAGAPWWTGTPHSLLYQVSFFSRVMMSVRATGSINMSPCPGGYANAPVGGASRNQRVARVISSMRRVRLRLPLMRVSPTSCGNGCRIAAKDPDRPAAMYASSCGAITANAPSIVGLVMLLFHTYASVCANRSKHVGTDIWHTMSSVRNTSVLPTRSASAAI